MVFPQYRLTDGEELWRLDVEEVTKGNNISDLILYGARLFVGVDTGTILCLNVATGKTMESIPLDKGRIKLYDGMIYGVGAQEVSVLNPETLQWHTIDLSPALKQQGLSFLPVSLCRWAMSLYFKDYDSPVVGVVKLSTPGVVMAYQNTHRAR